jgi:hypothetical protein
VVEIYCNIHLQMAASALVVPNRHYAKVKPDGSIHDGILGQPFTNVTMYKRIGTPANLTTTPGCQW